MHRYGSRIRRYLDDWLVLGSSFQEVMRARDFLLWLCQELGIRVNPSKSSLGLSGDESSNSSFEGFPDSKAISEALLSAARVRVLSAAASRVVASTSWSHVIPFCHRSGFSSADASSSTLTQHCQPPPSGLRFSVLGRFLPR